MDKLIEYNNSKNFGNLVFTLNIYSLKSWFGEMRVVAYCVMLIEGLGWDLIGILNSGLSIDITISLFSLYRS